MHKKGILAWGVFGVLTLGVLCNGWAFAEQTCSTDQQTGVVNCTNSATASVTVAAGCTFARDEQQSGNYSETLVNNDDTTVAGSTFTTFCNDPGGYAIYAIGYSNNTLGNTDLIFNDTPDSTYNIKTDGTGSNWKMAITATGGTAPTLGDGITLENYFEIPETYTKIAYLDTVTDAADVEEAVGSSISLSYQATASSMQPAGVYTGAVKYTMVHPDDAVIPTIDDLVYLQDFALLSNNEKAGVLASMTTGVAYTKLDKRDNQEYTIAKLADGKVWMTQNLNLAGGTTLTYSTTDFESDYEIPDTQGWGEGGVLPVSSTSFANNNYAYVYNSDSTTCGENSPCYSYYSWDAVTLGSGRDISSENTDADYSICPKGWRLPTSGDALDNGWKRGDFYALASAYDIDLSESATSNTSTFYDVLGPGTVPNFLLNGYYDDTGFINGGSNGGYWSATATSPAEPGTTSIRARNLYFSSSDIMSADESRRLLGFGVRCIAR